MNTLLRVFAALTQASQTLLGPEIFWLIVFVFTLVRGLQMRLWLRGNQTGVVPRGEWKRFLGSNFVG